MRKVRTLMLIAALGLPFGLSGCTPWSPGFWPFSMGVATPIPMPPWVTERMQEKLVHKNDFRTAILPPLQPGAPAPLCEDPPDEAQILRAMPQICRGVPYFYEEFRDDIQIVTERLVDKIDPPRFFPLIGLAQLHHCHYKCTVYYTETLESGYPFPYQAKRPRVEVIYIDKDHLHLCPGGNDTARQSVTRDVSGP